MGQIDINGTHCFDDAEAKMENKVSDEMLKQISEGEFIDPCINRPHLGSQSWNRKNVLFASDLAADLLSTRKELERVKESHAREVDQFNDGYKAAKAGLSEDDEPTDYEINEDQWRVGYAWGKYDELKAALSALQEATRWIPVRERLPEKDSTEVWETYICLIDWFGEIKTGALWFIGGSWYSDYVAKSRYDNEVMAWRELPPLPVPPEGGTK
jgi:hypothetical protein